MPTFVPGQLKLIQDLIDRGVSARSAQALVLRFDPQAIMRQIGYFDFEQRHGIKNSAFDDPATWLVGESRFRQLNAPNFLQRSIEVCSSRTARQ